MRTLIVYYSFTGNNKALAERLCERIECDILAVREERGRNGFSILLDLLFKRRARLSKYTVDVSAYDNVIVVAPVWAGKIATPMQTFLLNERRNLTRYSVFTVCGGVAGQREKLAEFMETLTGKRPAAVKELWVKDFLPAEKRDDPRFSSTYQVNDDDWKKVDFKIIDFLKALNIPTVEKMSA